MSKIMISDLDTAKSKAFFTSEDYLRDLSDDELNVRGGMLALIVLAVACAVLLEHD